MLDALHGGLLSILRLRSGQPPSICSVPMDSRSGVNADEFGLTWPDRLSRTRDSASLPVSLPLHVLTENLTVLSLYPRLSALALQVFSKEFQEMSQCSHDNVGTYPIEPTAICNNSCDVGISKKTGVKKVQNEPISDWPHRE
jgi:hypothetical protein